jgi:hypothetical protein
MANYIVSEEVLWQILETLEATVCDQEGLCCVGSDADRSVINIALNEIRLITTKKPPEPSVWMVITNNKNIPARSSDSWLTYDLDEFRRIAPVLVVVDEIPLYRKDAP